MNNLSRLFINCGKTYYYLEWSRKYNEIVSLSEIYRVLIMRLLIVTNILISKYVTFNIQSENKFVSQMKTTNV